MADRNSVVDYSFSGNLGFCGSDATAFLIYKCGSQYPVCQFGKFITFLARPWNELETLAMIRRVARFHGVSEELMLAIISCENGAHIPDRKNYLWPEVSASGLFQFTDQTYRSTRKAMGEPDPTLALKHNNYEQARTAAWKIAHGGIGAWNNSKSCWSK